MSYCDNGMFMQSIMPATTAHGLDTCAQRAWNTDWSVTRRVLNVPDDEYLIAGMPLGCADGCAPVNTLVAEREFHDVSRL